MKFFSTLLALLFYTITYSQNASFNSPDTVCVNTPVNVTNTTVGATNFYWSFCEATTNAPVANNLGTSSNLSLPVFTDLVKDDNGNYFAFITNNSPGGLTRLSFGASLLNVPAEVNFGDFGGIIPTSAEGIQVVKVNGNWTGIMVGGDDFGSRILKLDFGTSLASTPVATNWGNIGNLLYPHDLHLFIQNNIWYGFTVNANSNSLTRFQFGSNFSTPPTGTNMGNIGGLNTPVGIGAISNAGNWHLFITNAANSTLSRLNFGSSLLNVPSGVNIGNPGSMMNNPRDISFINLCKGIEAISVNAVTNTITKFDFGNNLLGIPTASSLGNMGNLNFPHSISELFRVDNDIYALIPNVNTNSVTRLRFAGCSGIPGSTLQNPSAVTYSQPGVYNINLLTDIGLPTQGSFCKPVVVVSCQGQNISNVINDYTPVISYNLCNNSLNVESGVKYNVGDTVLLIQMKGGIIDSTNSTAFGNIIDYKSAGNYEFNYVSQRTGNVVYLKNKITRQYDLPFGKVQLIRVPYYNSANITSTLTCLPWDGSKGGVLVLNVKDSVILNANIDVSDRGFKGGKGLNTLFNTLTCGQTNFSYPAASTIAALKGESITTLSSNKVSGRGASANGGGGGQDHNSGGGGGSNGSAGGIGGYQYFYCPDQPFDNRGIGGKALTYSNALNKVFLGGGGGAGHCNNLGFNSDGGNGGGIIIIKASKIINNNFQIRSNGANGAECTPNGNSGFCHEGMGGGGSGGSILIDNNTFVDATSIKSAGGKGANMTGEDNGQLGPGGGGSGGVLWLKNNTLPSNVSVASPGGLNGINVNIANSSWGATPGQAGINVFNLSLPFDTELFKKNIDSTRIAQAAVSCNAFDFQGLAYFNSSPITSWQWTFGDGGTANTQNTSHTYSNAGSFTVKLLVADANGCKDSVTRTVSSSSLAVTAGPDTSMCSTGSIIHTLQGATNGTTFSWSPASLLNNSTLQNPTATITATTTFYLTASNALGCTGKDSVTITLNPAPIVNIQNAPALCSGDTLRLQSTGVQNFQWIPASQISNPTSSSPLFIGSTNQSIIVTGTSANGCTGADTLAVIVKPRPVINSIGDTSLCSNQTVTLSTTGALTYSWSPATNLNNPSIASPVFAGNSGQTYVVTGTAANGCKDQDTVSVTIRNTAFNAPPAKEVCIGNSVQLDGNNGPSMIYAWTASSTLSGINTINPTASPTTSTQYDVLITDVACNNDSLFRVSVTVNPLPTITAVKANDIDCAHISAVLSATGGISYVWSPSATLNADNVNNPIATPLVNTEYIVSGTDSKGCKNADSVSVDIKTTKVDFYIPNSFTPNGDGLNECFGINHFGQVQDLIFIIYNRYGEKVFETNNVAQCWNGFYKGSAANAGGYVYYIKGKSGCGEIKRKGNVLLIR